MGAPELAGSGGRRWGGSDGAKLPAAVGLGSRAPCADVTDSAGKLLPATMVLSGVAQEPSLLAAGEEFLRDWGRQQLPFPSVGDLQMGGCNAASSAAPRSCPPSGSTAVDLRLVPPLEPQQHPSLQHPSLQHPSSQSGAVGSCSRSEPGVQRGERDSQCWLQEVEPSPVSRGWFCCVRKG